MLSCTVCIVVIDGFICELFCCFGSWKGISMGEPLVELIMSLFYAPIHMGGGLKVSEELQTHPVCLPIRLLFGHM